MNTSELNSIFDDYGKWFDRSVFFEFVAKTTPGGKRMLSQPMRYRSTLMWAICQDLTALGAVQSAVAPGAIPWLPKLQRGAWSDNRIAATAAYSQTLLSEDADLCTKARFAARFLGLPLVVMNVQQYLSAG